jgi:exopolyphosphatase/guanosine-5'-triphosphate,3'-diphosphate pyrophosphatase
LNSARAGDPRKVDHATFTIEQIRGLLRSFTGKSLHALKSIPGLPPKRADLIIPGTAVLLATMELLGAKRMSVSVRGLRYGVLLQALREGFKQ